MTLFKTYVCKWWQLSMLKIAMLALGIIIGAVWPAVFQPYVWYLLGLALIASVYLVYAWVEK
jgi:hypothetical protein